MRGFPISPYSSYYITRTKFVAEIVDGLKKLLTSAAYILVYGCGGSGKTVAVIQAIKEFLLLEENKKQYVFHWITVGSKIAQINLLYSAMPLKAVYYLS